MSCEKEITVDLPQPERKLVVDGQIELGLPPLVLLSSSIAPFEPTNSASLSSFYLRGADVSVIEGGTFYPLDEICLEDLNQEAFEALAEMLGISTQILSTSNICAYSKIDGSLIGEAGKIYDLEISYEDEYLSASTKLNEPVVLDSMWFSIPNPGDSLGFAFAILDDPDTLGNAYRWSAKRINSYPAWSQHAFQQKDFTFIAPLGSAYDDAFFNGLEFEFAYFRGSQNSGKEDDNNIEQGFFKIGDTIAVKGAHIDRGVFKFISAMEDQIGTQGSPFATPANLPSNIEGGLGLWAGYATSYDTIICTP
ncbi:MAG: DUF4249 domain-containing protein [Flavobacteriales bacterium]